MGDPGESSWMLNAGTPLPPAIQATKAAQGWDKCCLSCCRGVELLEPPLDRTLFHGPLPPPSDP
eukprot:4258172-Pyramimonas_sp.AAC.1